MQSISVLISYILFYAFDKTNFQERITQVYWFLQNFSKDKGQILYVFMCVLVFVNIYINIYEIIYLLIFIKFARILEESQMWPENGRWTALLSEINSGVKCNME